MHLVLLKVALITATVWPLVSALPFHSIVDKVALVLRPILHLELTVAAAHAIFVLTLELPIEPGLMTEAMLLLIKPVTFIRRLIVSDQLAFACSLAFVIEAAHVVAAVLIDHPAIATWPIIDEVALVALASGPQLLTFTVSSLL